MPTRVGKTYERAGADFAVGPVGAVKVLAGLEFVPLPTLLGAMLPCVAAKAYGARCTARMAVRGEQEIHHYLVPEVTMARIEGKDVVHDGGRKEGGHLQINCRKPSILQLSSQGFNFFGVRLLTPGPATTAAAPTTCRALPSHAPRLTTPCATLCSCTRDSRAICIVQTRGRIYAARPSCISPIADRSSLGRHRYRISAHLYLSANIFFRVPGLPWRLKPRVCRHLPPTTLRPTPKKLRNAEANICRSM
jgi:hypothetical protein